MFKFTKLIQNRGQQSERVRRDQSRKVIINQTGEAGAFVISPDLSLI